MELFVRGENAYAILKCVFKDNELRPKFVDDVKLSINVLESELISPMYHYQVTVESIMKDTIQKHIQDLIEKQVQQFNDDLVDKGKNELSSSEKMFEKVKRIETLLMMIKKMRNQKDIQFLQKNSSIKLKD